MSEANAMTGSHTVIRHGRLIDPANGRDEIADLYLAAGRIVAIGNAPADFVVSQEIDAQGLWVLPGLVDLHAQLREPGEKHKASIASETRAAAAAGVTTLCCGPDTQPVIDTPAIVELIHSTASNAGMTRVHPLAALTQGLAGDQLSEMHALRQAGCVAMSNGKVPMGNTLVLRRALEYAAGLDIPVMLYAEDPWLGATGCVHEGVVAARLGLPGIPSCAEVIAVGRDLMLIEQTGVRAHFCQLSSARAVELIVAAQQRGITVTADVCAHQLYLTEIDVGQFNSLCHVRPPLRSQRDRDGLRKALADGNINAICSDHQPHDADAKLAPFPTTEPGISALETLLPLTLRLVDESLLTLAQAVAAVSSQPAKILGLDAGTLSLGAMADICIVDPHKYWTVSAQTLRSRGKNTPLLGWEMKGQVSHTLLAGKIVFQQVT
ncbi:MAG: dihydroorotase [Thiohalomonadaceae bacterium]